MRKAFSMITAIFVMLIMATVSMMILNLSSQTTKNTTMQYKQEQAILYAKSYTELAIMYATANDPTVTNCAEDINANIGGNVAAGDGYNIQVRIAYINSHNQTLTCSGTRIFADKQATTDNVTTMNERHIIIDTYVRYHDDAVASAWTGGGTPPWLTYHRRTLQKL
jgi:type II secretory pathway pseudopilin PulG